MVELEILSYSTKMAREIFFYNLQPPTRQNSRGLRLFASVLTNNSAKDSSAVESFTVSVAPS
jgi:hypothetical protein